jgi:uncharacterized membrane protein
VNNTLTSSTIQDNRIQTIDILRGIFIALMALDHVRDFFLFDAFAVNPTDPDNTTFVLFTTRWITHICAPGFVWLSGVSAYIYYNKNGIAKTRTFLLSRGLMLIALEFTLVKLAWHFNLDYSNIAFLVIWALGVSMILLALIMWLQHQYILILGVTIILCHNLLDSINLGDTGFGALLWHTLHQKGLVLVTPGFNIKVLYPILPMYGLICLGFGMGNWFTDETEEVRKALFKRMSIILLLSFISIRILNDYGDPSPWVFNQHTHKTIFSFLNVTKYPMSLDYILIMLAGIFYLTYKIKGGDSKLNNYLKLFGKTSLFFYIIHLFIIHLLAIILLVINRYETIKATFPSIDVGALTQDYGYSIGIVYIIWIGVLILIYPICKKYRQYKLKFPKSFLRFI